MDGNLIAIIVLGLAGIIYLIFKVKGDLDKARRETLRAKLNLESAQIRQEIDAGIKKARITLRSYNEKKSKFNDKYRPDNKPDNS